MLKSIHKNPVKIKICKRLTSSDIRNFEQILDRSNQNLTQLRPSYPSDSPHKQSTSSKQNQELQSAFSRTVAVHPHEAHNSSFIDLDKYINHFNERNNELRQKIKQMQTRKSDIVKRRQEIEKKYEVEREKMISEIQSNLKSVEYKSRKKSEISAEKLKKMRLKKVEINLKESKQEQNLGTNRKSMLSNENDRFN